MLVDSASRLQWLYGPCEKSAAVILAVVKRFVPDMGVSRAFQADKSTEYSNSIFVDFCTTTGLGTSRVYGTVYAAEEWPR